MIIENKKIIFCHIDKTGGSSISKSLSPELVVSNPDEPVQHDLKHFTMNQLINLLDNPLNYFKFCFVRNPYDRALSKYFHHRKVSGGNPFEQKANKLCFKEWVKNNGLQAFRPQFHYIYNNEILLCDFVGKFENLQEDYKVIQDKFNLPELCHINENYKKPKNLKIIDYYDKHAIEFVNQNYFMDFKYFGYQMYQFDIVIPLGPNDIEQVYKQVEYTKKNIIGYRKIFVISFDPNIKIDGCITVPEQIFPFNKQTIINFHGPQPKNGWFLQQLLKLYAGKCLPDLMNRYLVIDSDTFFLKPTRFISDNNKCLYNFGHEYWIPYFKHIEKLNINLKKVYMNKSGICHHMMFETTVVNELIHRVENVHKDAFYNVFLKYVDPRFKNHSGASEYEIYFNYVFQYHPNRVQLRELKWINAKELNQDSEQDYISCHYYLKGTT
jgi:hypothetical protein